MKHRLSLPLLFLFLTVIACSTPSLPFGGDDEGVSSVEGSQPANDSVGSGKTEPLAEPTAIFAEGNDTADTADTGDTSSNDAVDAPAAEAQMVEISLPKPYNEAGMAVLAKLNDWRVSEGLSPLRPNETLDALADGQAQYLLSLADFPDDIHIDGNGQYPPARARNADWPIYNNPDQIAVTEIGYIGADAQTAVTWWDGSAIHNASVTNPAFREVGVAAYPHPYGTLYMVVMGARPNTLPALLDPSDGTFYLTTEQYRWASEGVRIKQVSGFQFLPSYETPVDSENWTDWETTVTIPDVFGAEFMMAFFDGEYRAIYEVDLSEDIAWFTHNLNEATIARVSQSQSLADSEAEEPAVAEESAATEEPVVEEEAADEMLEATEVAETPEEPAAAEETPEADSAPASDDVDIIIRYDDTALTITSVSPEFLINMRQFWITDGTTNLTTGAWESRGLLAIPLERFPSTFCLQIWVRGVTDASQPEECETLAAAIFSMGTVEEEFWRDTDFDVMWGSLKLATCLRGEAYCEVKVP